MYVDEDRIERESIGDLLSRAVDEGKTFATAKVDVVKQTALDRVDRAKLGVGLIVVGGLLAYAAVIVLLIAVFLLVIGRDRPAWGWIVVAGATLVTAFVMVKIGAAKVANVSADANGKAS